MKKKIADNKICVVCGKYSKNFLCGRHRKRFIYYKDHNIIGLKARRKISKPQTKVFRMVRDEFRKPTFQEVVFPWNLFFRYDIGVPDIKLIVEYDSKLHFEYNEHFHKTKKNFKRRQQIDVDKENIAKDHDYKVLRINYKDKDKDIKDKIKWMKKKL